MGGRKTPAGFMMLTSFSKPLASFFPVGKNSLKMGRRVDRHDRDVHYAEHNRQ